MAEHTTEQSTSVGDNGQQPADEKPWNIRDQIVNAMGQRELVTTVLRRLSLSPYNAHILYRPVFQHRFAEIRRDDRHSILANCCKASAFHSEKGLVHGTARLPHWHRRKMSLILSRSRLWSRKRSSGSGIPIFPSKN